MTSPYLVLPLTAVLAATNTNALGVDSLGSTPMVLCLIKPSNAVTAVNGKVTMSDDGSNFFPVLDETGAELTFVVEDEGYIRMKPSDYAAFAKHTRLEFDVGLSAATSFDLYFRKA